MDDLKIKEDENSPKYKNEELAKKLIDIALNFKESPETIVEYLQFTSQFHRYSAKNLALVQNQRPNSSYLGSYQDFKKLGFPVRRGEHGMKIFVPVTKIYYRKNDDKTWKPLSLASKTEKAAIKAKIGYETKTVQTYTVGTIFDISQTTCPPEKYPQIFHFGQKDLKSAVLIDGLKEYCTIVNISLEEDAKFNSPMVKGYYVVDDEKIVLNSLLQDNEKLSTFTHELGHRLMFRSSDLKKELAKPESQIELEADALSFLLMQHFNQEITEGRRRHLAQSYSSFIDDQEKKTLDEQISFLDIMDKVKSVYNNEIELIDETINKHTEINRNIYQLENSDYKAKYEVHFIKNEYNDYLTELQNSDFLPMPEKMTVNQTQKMVDQIEDEFYKSKHEKTYEVKYYIVDLEDKQTIFKGDFELGTGIRFLDHVVKESKEIGNIIQSPELKESFDEILFNLKTDVYKEQLQDYNKNFPMMNVVERKEVIEEIKKAKKDLSIHIKEKEQSDIKNKQQIVIKKEAFIEK